MILEKMSGNGYIQPSNLSSVLTRCLHGFMPNWTKKSVTVITIQTGGVQGNCFQSKKLLLTPQSLHGSDKQWPLLSEAQ